MPSKRTRIDSSGNFINMNESAGENSSQRVASPVGVPAPAPPALLRPSAEGVVINPPPPAAAALAGGSGSSQVRLGQFLEKCFFCKKSIPKDSNIFMYRSCAFCGEECRNMQISIDGKMGKIKEAAATKP